MTFLKATVVGINGLPILSFLVLPIFVCPRPLRFVLWTRSFSWLLHFDL